MKRVLSRAYFHFLKKELTYLEENGKLEKGQANDLIACYEIEERAEGKRKQVNPMNVLLTIGAVLIGLSMLSFVASNWSALSASTKFVALLVLLIAFYVTGVIYEKKNKALSRAFYYIGAFAYGAEIVYIGQLFHLGGEAQDAILWWGVGVLPLGFYLKDRALKLISLLFIYVYLHMQYMFVDTHAYIGMMVALPLLFLFGHYVMKRDAAVLVANFILLYEFVQIHLLLRPIEYDHFPFIRMMIALPVLFFVGHRVMNKSKVLFVANLFLTLETIGMLFFVYGGYESWAKMILTFFVIGTVIVYVQHKDYKEIMRNIGLLLQVLTGILLTFDIVWQDLFNDAATPFVIAFSVLYVIYNLYYVKKGSLLHVVVISALIVRFYVDLSLTFMSKSIFFAVLGVILILLAYWFDRTRKKGAKKDAEL